jgi:lipoprotein-anchoring transpeptidase ErfK/SrfK
MVRAINGAKQRREIPAASTIGGEVGIHGVSIGEDLLVETKTNWTWGCPSLRRQDVDELYEFVNIGTVVEIIGIG